MLNVMHTTLTAGLAEPVRLLHITDVHVTRVCEQDSPWQQEQMRKRTVGFWEEGGKPEYTPEEFLEQALKLAEEVGAVPVISGDVIDLHTPGNLEWLQQFLRDHPVLFTPGGHEYQKQFVRVMEEPDNYGRKMLEQFKTEFPEINTIFESHIIGGVNVILANNAMDFYPLEAVEWFAVELERDYPIVLFSHDPLDDKRLIVKTAYHPAVNLTEEEYAVSHRVFDELVCDPKVLSSFTGHDHESREYVIGGKTHYVTDGLFRGVCRLIEIR